MPLILLALVLLLPVLFVLLLPVSIVQRYRAGTARRTARPWLASLNAAGISLSIVLFTISATVMNTWVPDALLCALGGLLAGGALGLLGLKLTRWESTARGLHYTPSRPLMLLITVAVAARIIYGFWRGWHAWRDTGGHASWLAASGAAGSLAVGGVVLAYYLIYWAGVARRLKSRGKLRVTRVS